MSEHVSHTLAPIFNPQSKVLMLGTMPSPKSREVGFYYGHPQNKFWKVMSDLFQEEIPQTIEEKEAFLYRHHIALWDVLQSCDIKGADDSTIKNPVPNDLSVILEDAPIQAIFTTGAKAFQLYKKHIYPKTQIEAKQLPSTSPANCRFYKYEDILQHYEVVKKYLD
ncbi:MAG TPA: DNA-deoxyinosine glycosylase [Firmicutes bacterium]|nr:DNA-deoxyinosine glycosylase [Bacillota bacterium]